MAQIAAEELGLPLDRVSVSLGDSARGPYAAISAGSSTIPSMGPAVRAAAHDAARQIIEIAAQRYHLEERVLSLEGGQVVSADGGAWPLEEVTGLLEDAQILGKGARGPNPAGMRVLTFGVQVAEVAVDVETGEVRVDKIVADPRRGARDQPARRLQPGRGRDHPGPRPHALRAAAPRSADGRRAEPDARRVQDAHDRRRAGDRHRAGRRPGRAPDQPRREGPRRAADHPDGGGDRERDPRRDGRGRPLAPDLPRGDAARAREKQKEKTVELLQPSSLEELEAAPGLHAGGRDGPRPDRPEQADRHRHAGRHPRSSFRAGSTARGSAPGRRSPSSRSIRRSRTRCARRARWRPRRSCGRWAPSAATCARRRAAGTGVWAFRATSTAANGASPWTASSASTRSSPTSCTASAHPSDPAAALLALDARVRTSRRELPIAELYRLPTDDNRDVVALDYDEVILELDVPQPDASTYLKAGDRQRLSFPLVGVAAARFGERRPARARRGGADPVGARLGRPASTRRRPSRERRTRSRSPGP